MSIPWAPVLNSQSETQRTILRASGALSIAGALAVVIAQLYYWKQNVVSRRLLLWLSLADIGCAAAWIFGSTIVTPLSPPNSSCTAQAYLLQYFTLAAAAWTAAMAAHVFRLVVLRSPEGWRGEAAYHVLAWGVPLVICMYFYVRSQMGYSGMGDTERTWCWISSMNANDASWSALGSAEQFGLFYAPLMLVLAFNVVVYGLLLRVLGRIFKAEAEANMRSKLLQYLLVYVLISVWGLANRVYQVFSPLHAPQQTLILMECIMGPAQGALNALVYGTNPRMWHAAVRWLARWVCCSAGPEPEASTITPVDSDGSVQTSRYVVVLTDSASHQPLLTSPA